MDELDFFKDVSMIKIPFGGEMGGSGLTAFPREL
jgi:hypothetical protein